MSTLTTQRPGSTQDVADAFVRYNFDGNPLEAMRAIADAHGIAFAYQDRGTLEATLGRVLTSHEWGIIRPVLDGYDEFLDNSGAGESLSMWRHRVLELIPHMCAECGEPMFVTSAGVAHHVIEDGMGESVEGLSVDHDADADHVPMGEARAVR